MQHAQARTHGEHTAWAWAWAWARCQVRFWPALVAFPTFEVKSVMR